MLMFRFGECGFDDSDTTESLQLGPVSAELIPMIRMHQPL